jgi:hypothetical protein
MSPHLPTVMAGFVPAIRSGRVLDGMAGSSPTMTIKRAQN